MKMAKLIPISLASEEALIHEKRLRFNSVRDIIKTDAKIKNNGLI
jgi:hypothetical protein